MSRIMFASLAGMVLVLCFVWSATAAAGDGRSCPGDTPAPNAAHIGIRNFNDCPASTIGVVNSYPSSISMSEDLPGTCTGFANLHAWSFSTDGGATSASFENCSRYEFCASVVITGSGDGQGGLRLSPWYSPDVDGTFSLNTYTGEIVCSGGRLPFYSFTNSQGVTYAKGVNAFMKIIYSPHALSAAMPATIEYRLALGGGPMLSSGQLPFDQGNPAEDPPHGLWGELVPAYAGGFFMPLIYAHEGQDVSLACQWSNICYQIMAVSISDASVTEGNSGTTPATFDVSIPTSSDTVKVSYATQDGSATVAGNDYLPASGTLVFAPGDTHRNIDVQVRGDLVCELLETFFISLTSATNAAIADGQGLGTILNDDSQSPPLPAGGVGWWRGEGDGTDELSGNTLFAQNGAGFGAGKAGLAFALDGVDDFFAAPDQPSLRPRNLTLEGWFRFDAGTGPRVLASKTLGLGTNDSYQIFTQSEALYAGVGDGTGVSVLSTPFIPTPGQWYHIAYTFDDDGNTHGLYLDGTLRASGAITKTIAYDAHPLLIGAEYENEAVSFFFSGSIDEVMLYDRPLTSGEVATDYLCGRATNTSCMTLPAGSAAWWRAEGDGADLVGAHTLTLLNGAGFDGGRVGQGLSLDGIDDQASASDSPSLHPHNFTLEGWVRFDRGGFGLDETLVSKSVGSGALRSFGIYRGHTTLSGMVSDLVNMFTVEFFFAPTAGVWYHIAYVYDDDADTHSIYLDGVLRASNPVPATAAYDIHPLLLGADSDGRLLDGTLDELTLYNRALPATTIDSLYHAYRFGKCPGLVGVIDPMTPVNAGALRFEPTPFSGTGRVRFALAERAYVELAIYDVAGRRVAMLADRELDAGPHERNWDGRDQRGQDTGTGVYFVRLETRGVSGHRSAKRTVATVRVR